MKRVLAALDDLVDSAVDTYAATERGLSLFRIVFGLSFIALLTPRFLWGTGYPDFLYQPPPPLSLIDCSGQVQPGLVCGFPPFWVVLGLEACLSITAVCLLFGYRTRYVSLLFTALFVLLNAFRFSFGKIDHGIMYVITPTVLAFSGWGNYFSLDAQRGRTSAHSYPCYSLVLLAGCMSTGFLSAGLPKAILWLDFDLSTSGVRQWFVNGYYVRGRTDLLAPIFSQVQSAWVFEGMDYAAVLFELGFAASVLHGWWFRRFVCLAVPFHIFNYLVLNIPYYIHFPVYAAFLPWDRIATTVSSIHLKQRIQAVDGRHLIGCASAYMPLHILSAYVDLSTLLGVDMQMVKASAVFGVAVIVLGMVARWKLEESP